MTPNFRKGMLTTHIAFSVGWLGAVAVFLAHAIIGLTSQDSMMVRAAYLAMELSAWLVIVPSSFGSLLTGLVQSLGTKWGLFKHYWIVVKLFLTIVITILLLLHTQPISIMAGIASETAISNADHRGLQIQLVVDAAAAFLVLLAITAISVYKPWGMTAYGLRKLQSRAPVQKATAKKFLGNYWLLGLLILVLLIVILHLLGGIGGH